MARQQFYYNVMRKTIIQFLNMFQDIVIARYNPETEIVVRYVRVPIRFAPKTKQWYWKELKDNKDRRDNALPMIAVNLESVEYASDRQVNRNATVSFSNDGSTIKQHLNPVPYNFTFSMQIVAEHMVDIIQVVEQVFPFFTPEAYIRITIPELNITGLSENGELGSDKLDLKVLYDSASKDAPIELDEAGFRALMWTINFTVQGYLFSPIFDAKPIYDVVQNYYMNTTSAAQAVADNDKTLPTKQFGSQIVQGITSATNIPVVGGASDISIIYAGTDYVDGLYEVEGGSGSGMTVTVTAVDGEVTQAVITTPGTGYTVNNQVIVLNGGNDCVLRVESITTDQVDDSIREMYTYENYYNWSV